MSMTERDLERVKSLASMINKSSLPLPEKNGLLTIAGGGESWEDIVERTSDLVLHIIDFIDCPADVQRELLDIRVRMFRLSEE